MSSQRTSPRRPAPRPSHRRRTAFAFGVIAVAGGLVGWAPSARAQGDSTTTVAPTTSAVTVASTSTSSIAAASGGVLTTVAPVKSGKTGAKVVVYKTASTASPLKTLVNGTNVKGRVVFTVIENQGAWLKVYAPVRPNGTIGYVKASDIDTQFTHNWRITVEISARRLTVYKGNQVMDVETVAVGKQATPTPLGHFYTVDLLKPKGGATGAYGPYAYGLSGFSNVLQKFGTGDGRVGIHGTNTPSALGQAVTSGCVRLSNSAITKLKEMLPLGVPVDIVA